MARLRYIYEDYVSAPTPESHSQSKRRRLEASMQEEQQPAPAEQPEAGWSPVWPDNPEHFVAGVRVVRQPDGTFTKQFRVLVRPEVLKQKKRKAKNMLKRIRREDREANMKLAKLRVRCLLAMMGKA